MKLHDTIRINYTHKLMDLLVTGITWNWTPEKYSFWERLHNNLWDKCNQAEEERRVKHNARKK